MLHITNKIANKFFSIDCLHVTQATVPKSQWILHHWSFLFLFSSIAWIIYFWKELFYHKQESSTMHIMIVHQRYVKYFQTVFSNIRQLVSNSMFIKSSVIIKCKHFYVTDSLSQWFLSVFCEVEGLYDRALHICHHAYCILAGWLTDINICNRHFRT